MRISRLYIHQELAADTQLSLSGQQAHYLSKVLRLKANAPLIVFNGQGAEFSATVLAVDKHRVLLGLEKPIHAHTESPLQTILGLGLSRGERMDYAIQKSTELGVSRIVPLFTEFCEVKLVGERLQKKLQHWRQISISACEQSGRTVLPMIEEPQSLPAWCQSQHSPLKLIFSPQGQKLQKPESVAEVSLLIGPEGGFSAGELESAVAAGFQAIQLGPRILRTETAPIAALTALQLLWGDFSW